MTYAPVVETLAKYLVVFGVGMLKPAFGPATARGLRLSPFEAMPLSALGIAFSVFVVAYFGERFMEAYGEALARRFPKVFGRAPSPRLARVFEKWGLAGIAAITPVLLSPVGGAIAGIAFGIPRKRLVFAMAVSAVAWTTFYTVAIYAFDDVLVGWGWLDPMPDTSGVQR